MDRRAFLATGGVLGATGLLHGAAEPLPPMPRIKLGKLEISRFVLGSNPFFGYAHQPGNVGARMKAWYTPERIIAVMDEAASYGVTAVATSPEQAWVEFWKRYRDGGGKLITWLAQCHGAPEKMPEEILRAARGGAGAIFFQGHRVESRFETGKFAEVKTWLELAKVHGVPVGMAAHRPDVHLEAEELGFPTDFYYQCFYNVAHGETYRDEDRAKAIATIKALPKPVIGYKLLAAGRNEPKAAFAYARAHLRPTDGMCVGIWNQDRPDELRQDVALALGA
jgi:hypothetical protein